MEQLSKRLYERVLGAEMTHYLGYEKGQAPKLEADQKRTVTAISATELKMENAGALAGGGIRYVFKRAN